MTTFQQLPPEILTMIFDYAHIEVDQQQSDENVFMPFWYSGGYTLTSHQLAGICLLCRSIRPIAEALLWDTIFLGSHHLEAEAFHLTSFIRLCTAIQIRKQSGRSVKFRRLFIAFHCLQAIVAVPGSHEVLLDIISSLQPDEVVISGGWDMIKDWTWNGQLGFTKLVLYLYAGDDLRIIPEILSGCAETLTHLEIAMGYYHDGRWRLGRLTSGRSGTKGRKKSPLAVVAAAAEDDADSRAAGRFPTDSKDQVKEQEQEQESAVSRTSNLPRSQSIHKHIQPPRYVRSVPLGLQRANTISSPIKAAASSGDKIPADTDASSPVASTRVYRPRRISVPHPPANDGQDAVRPLPPRSESALGIASSSSSGSSPVKLSFSKSYNGQLDRRTQSLLYEYGDTSQVSELPADPKVWTPSQLSIYLSHMLRLTPRPVISDVMKFVVQRGLTGKRFLRLRNQDLIEMGINVNWCRVLSTARERLRRECLRGRIFGFTVQPAGSEGTSILQEEGEEEDIDSLFLKLPASSSTSSLNQEWNKNSWRRNEGKKSRGRVKGIAQVFESGDADELGVKRRSSLARSTAELDEVARIRRSRQESTDSEMSSVSARSFGSYSRSKRMSLPTISLGLHDKEETSDTVKVTTPSTPRQEEASESESEAEDAFTASATKVDWATVEPLALEDTLSLSESFYIDQPNASSSSSSSSPSTPCASTFVQPDLKQHPLEIAGPSEKADQAASADGPYQSRILSHGSDAYAAIRSRKQSDLSEVTDELSEEHLAYWNTLPYEDQYPKSPYSTVSRSSMPRPDLSDLSNIEQEITDEIVAKEASSSAMVFAESDGNIITMKKQQPQSLKAPSNIVKRTRSVEDFGSLKLQNVQSRSASKGDNLLKDLFEEKTAIDHDGDMDTAARFGITTRKKKDSRRLSDLFRGDDDVSSESLAKSMVVLARLLTFMNLKGEQYYSFKSRSGSVMMLPRAEVEEMQARLKDLERQLELAKSASASSSSKTRQLEERQDDSKSRNEAMSAWVKDALGEANTIVRDGNQEPSWLGLGGWALAAGLGIGIVVGEAVFSKLRRCLMM
ncbi:hypothetical protein P389DRAFT_187279 [Cystobasidium minutum MCA 4210]|uniref:uncharacterized protein n=1 Tax=Cystobasidium minutum MCA 4210 TaxID=1397322 RepID=UPI0034CD2A49|eukprot:jgi/Rhomi1/187279/estExt_fgenesh1_pg.C_1_t20074